MDPGFRLTLVPGQHLQPQSTSWLLQTWAFSPPQHQTILLKSRFQVHSSDSQNLVAPAGSGSKPTHTDQALHPCHRLKCQTCSSDPRHKARCHGPKHQDATVWGLQQMWTNESPESPESLDSLIGEGFPCGSQIGRFEEMPTLSGAWYQQKTTGITKNQSLTTSPKETNKAPMTDCKTKWRFRNLLTRNSEQSSQRNSMK